ncbi:hypothetical protein HDU99_001799, partial [Rhizoclosmatium hyalinum]
MAFVSTATWDFDAFKEIGGAPMGQWVLVGVRLEVVEFQLSDAGRESRTKTTVAILSLTFALEAEKPDWEVLGLRAKLLKVAAAVFVFRHCCTGYQG